jgi:hypothetical protein
VGKRVFAAGVASVLALVAAAPAQADAPSPDTLYLWAHGKKSIGLVWSFLDMGRVNVSISCGDRNWYRRTGPPVNAANHFRMRFNGKIKGVPGAKQKPDGSTVQIPAPHAVKLVLRGSWPTRKRARVYVKHSKCFPHGRRITLRSQALN